MHKNISNAVILREEVFVSSQLKNELFILRSRHIKRPERRSGSQWASLRIGRLFLLPDTPVLFQAHFSNFRHQHLLMHENQQKIAASRAATNDQNWNQTFGLFRRSI